MLTHSEHIEPRPLRLHFLIRLRGTLCGTFTVDVVGEQQHTARATGDYFGHVLYDKPTRWYTWHLASWDVVSRPKLHVSHDHVYRHVCMYAGLHHCQLAVPIASKSVESGEEAEDEQGGRTGGARRS